jgi:hypothetical protein
MTSRTIDKAWGDGNPSPSTMPAASRGHGALTQEGQCWASISLKARSTSSFEPPPWSAVECSTLAVFLFNTEQRHASLGMI